MSERKWVAFMVYGSFTDPETNLNFFFARMPEGRVPWSKKIAPALDRIVRATFSEREIKDDRNRRISGRESNIHWNIEGEPEPGSYWTVQRAVTRYEWNGSEMVKIDQRPTI